MRRYWIKCEHLDYDGELNPSSTIGSAKGCSIPLPEEEDIAGTHARVVVDDEGRWRLAAIQPEHYPVYDGRGQAVPTLVIDHKTIFRIGSNSFVCRIEEDAKEAVGASAAKARRTGKSKTPSVMRPPQGVKSLQYFFSDRLYRIAVLGGRESGKTCMFAALGMPRIPRADGASCTRIHHLRAPDPEPWQKTPEDREAEEAFRSGKVLLDIGETVSDRHIPGAIDSLLQGRVPQATRTDKVDARIVFKLTSPQRLPAMLETVDYAGEFAAPEMALDEQARRITDILQDSNGLIILAQVPMPGSDYDKEVAAIDQMAKTFAMLRLGRSIPVALVVNKWDRRNGFGEGSQDYDEQRRALTDYVASDEGQHLKALADALRNVVGDANFTMLPVSALGKCELVDGMERPRQNLPLKSFGLEDPFFWLMDRVDALAVEEYEQAARSLSLMPLAALWGKQARSLRGRKSQLLSGGVTNTKLRPRIRRAGRKCAFKRFLAKCQIGVLVIVSVLVAEYVWQSRPLHDAFKMVPSRTHIADATAYSASRADVARLRSYVSSPVFRHVLMGLIVNREAASNAVICAESNQAGFLIGAISDTNRNLEARIGSADTLRTDYPVMAGSQAMIIDPVETQYKEMLWEGITNDNGRIENRIQWVQKFIGRYSDDRRKQEAESILEKLKVAQDVQARVDTALRDKKWNDFTAELTAPRYPKLEHPLRQQIVRDAEDAIDGKLLSFVNDSIGKLQDITRLEKNADLQTLHRSREHLSSCSDASNLVKRFEATIDKFQDAIRDRRLYSAASHTNRRAANLYLSASSTSSTNPIPGFMCAEVEAFMDRYFDGKLVIEHIDWFGGKDTRPVTIYFYPDGSANNRIKISGSNTEPKIKFTPGRGSPLNEEVDIRGLRMNSVRKIAVGIVMDARVKGDPEFSAITNYYADELFRGVKIIADETEATKGHRRAEVHIRLHHKHCLPDWKAGRFRGLGSGEWE